MTDLSGRRVLLTRSAAGSAGWAGELRRWGIEPVVLPCLRTEPLAQARGSVATGTLLTDATWLAFTSPRGVEAFSALLDGPAPPGVRIAAVGAATARAAAEHLTEPDLVAPSATAASLAESLAPRLEPDDVVVAALSSRAPHTLEGALSDRCRFVRLDVYRTVPSPRLPAPVRLDDFQLDAAWLASPTAVEGLGNQAAVPSTLRCVSLGPTTSAALVAAGWTLAAEATSRDFAGMLAATSFAFSTDSSRSP